MTESFAHLSTPALSRLLDQRVTDLNDATADGEPIAKYRAARDRAYEALSERYEEEQP